MITPILISDAEVEAAIKAWFGILDATIAEKMRAALEAAAMARIGRIQFKSAGAKRER